MRVALLSGNAPIHNAIGNQIAERVRFFQERGAEVRLYVQDGRRLHPELIGCCVEVTSPDADGSVGDYLRNADLVIAAYAQYHDLLPFLPGLVGKGPRIVFDYFGVTPPALWNGQGREGVEQSSQQRGYVWCADHALAASEASRRELLEATQFSPDHVTALPLVVDQVFRPEPCERFLQQSLAIDGPIILYVGRLAGNKRVPLLIEALARLGDPSVHVVIVGDLHDVYADEAARCQAVARELGVAKRVHFMGQLDDAALASAYRSAAVLVMPSLHEGFCVPVIEAMASGLPVIASRSAALPETVGGAGLTFVPNDVDDLVCQLRRVLGVNSEHGPRSREGEAPAEPDASALAVSNRSLPGSRLGGSLAIPTPIKPKGPRRVAIVSFRFGPDIVGGAETSLRTMAASLQNAGEHVEVFTTCTRTESHWRNDFPRGTVTLGGLTVHRFPIDAHDATAHGEIVRTILAADGRVAPALEQQYLDRSIHSSALIDALTARRADFDAIITGPYLFGLTADVATALPDRTLLVPCFHDEALARLGHWPTLYGNVGGILFHSAEEQALAQQQLGVNHPNSWEIGTRIETAPSAGTTPFQRPYLVYCGRYSAQKNVPMLLEWMTRCHGPLDIVFMGQGDVKLPGASWLHDLGHVDEATKRSVLAGAKALVQLSRQESLSLVVLEAWAAGTPVIVHRDCAVLVGQIERAQGGVAVADEKAFAVALEDLLQNDQVWRDRGALGCAYVNEHYASAKNYVARLIHAIDQLGVPLHQQMRERGIERGAQFRRERWQPRFAEFVEQLLTQPPRPWREALCIEPLRAYCHAAEATGTLLLPVRLVNAGTHAAAADGPGRTVVCCEIRTAATGLVALPCTESPLPALLRPGQTHVAALPIALPAEIGSYRIVLWLQSGTRAGLPVEVALTIQSGRTAKSSSTVATFLDTVQATLPRTHQLQELPDDYVDVTEGGLAPVKRLIKRKLLNNFKQAYVDVLSRQQSQVNGQVVLMIQQLAECCAMLDHAVTGLHQRLDGIEAKMDEWRIAGQRAFEPAEEP